MIPRPGISLIPPSGGVAWRNQTYLIEGQYITDISATTDHYEGDRVSFKLVGNGASRFLREAMDGTSAPDPVDHQEEAIAAARRDAAEAKRRAAAAEKAKAALEEELEDYRGEVEALREELKGKRLPVITNFAMGGTIPPMPDPLPPGKYSVHNLQNIIKEEQDKLEREKYTIEW